MVYHIYYITYIVYYILVYIVYYKLVYKSYSIENISYTTASSPNKNPVNVFALPHNFLSPYYCKYYESLNFPSQTEPLKFFIGDFLFG